MSELSLSPVLTSAGLAAVAAAHGQGLQAKITHIALGDGGYTIRDASDAPLAAAQARTVMQSEQVRVGVYAGAVPGPQQIVVEARIDAGKPNFWVKEVGFFLEDGTLFAIWSSDTINLGFRGDLVPWVFRFALAWTQLPDNAVTVEFSGDAGYSDLWGRLNDHITSKDPHPTQIEPAFRTDCEPCLLEFAEPGENLPAPFVFSRPGKGIGFNPLGQYTMVDSGMQRDWFDPETQEYKGKLTLPAYRSSCVNYNAAPTDLTGIQGPYGDENAVLSVVNDTEELGKVHILKQLLREGTLNGNVFKVDNSLGSSGVYVAILGNTSTTGAVTTISAWCRTTNGGRVDMAGGFGAQNFTNTGYERIHKTVDMPDDRSGQCAIIAEAGSSVWFILNQCEVGAAPSFVPVITEGAAYATTADVLTIGPVEADTIFEDDFANDTGWSLGENWVISEGSATVANTPTLGENRELKRFDALKPNRRYRLYYDVIANTTSAFTFAVASGSYSVNLPGTVGSHIADFTSASTGELRFGYARTGSGAGLLSIDNIRVVELVPFEGWDSDAPGQTMLLDTDTPLSGYSAVPGLVDLSDSTGENLYYIYQNAANGQMGVRVKANGGPASAMIVPNVSATDVLSVFQFNENTMRLAKTGTTNIAEMVPSGMPAGICYIKFGIITLKRFAVYNRYLPEADLPTMVTK